MNVIGHQYKLRTAKDLALTPEGNNMIICIWKMNDNSQNQTVCDRVNMTQNSFENFP